MTIVERFGRNVAAARVFARMGQAELAAAAGISQSHMSLIEAGKRQVGIVLAETLAGVLRVDLATLLSGAPFGGKP